ncbi:MAG: restriction endonuclease subunit S [Pseudomonadota bacterium]|nr:restriction endonuclease subunit S [Pseudomonadota bacterium]
MSVCSELIGDYVERITTWSPAKSNVAAFRYIDLGSVSQEEKSIVGASVLPTSEAPSRARQIVEAGDVLVSTVRPNLNGVAYVPPEFDGCTASTGFCVLRPREGRLSGRYLYHWVRSSAFVKDMVSKSTGASYPAVSDKIVKASSIPLPPLYEQRRIAAILDKADSLRQKRKQAIALLDSFTQSIFLEMFRDPRVPCITVELKEAVKAGTIVTYGIVQAGEEFKGGVPYIRTGDIRDGSIATTGLRHTDPTIAAKFDRSRVRAGEIVMSIRATVGTTALVPPELDGANLTQGTARISPGKLVTPEYLIHYLRSDAVQTWIQRQVKGATFREITLTRLRQLEVRIPPMELQENFSKIIRKREAELKGAHMSLGKLNSLFASLQHRAFAGGL